VRRWNFVALGAALSLSLAAGAGAAEGDAKAESGSGSAAQGQDVSSPPPVYQLPKVGKPRGRVGGGRRGTVIEVPDVYTLVPDHVGYTTSAQPTLYWYLSDKAKGDILFELTLTDDTSIDPLVDKRLAAPTAGGLQSVDLSDYGVRLEPGREYQWSVSLVPDPKDRSKDVVASGWIERQPEPDGLASALEKAGPDEAAKLYGQQGLWYDMLGALGEQIRRNPADAHARQELASLLEQAGLPTAAARP
jgi:hypothetical protein